MITEASKADTFELHEKTHVRYDSNFIPLQSEDLIHFMYYQIEISIRLKHADDLNSSIAYLLHMINRWQCIFENATMPFLQRGFSGEFIIFGQIEEYF